MEPKMLYRSFKIEKAQKNDSREIELTFSSEEPYERYYGIEILDHSAKAVRLERLNKTGPLLVNHMRDDQVGKVEKAFIGDDRRGRAVVRFSRSVHAEEIYQDVLDEIRQNVSVGYLVHSMVLVEEKDDVRTYRADDWEPLEVSIVSIPADTTVGVGRALSEEDIKNLTSKQGEQSCSESSMKDLQDTISRDSSILMVTTGIMDLAARK